MELYQSLSLARKLTIAVSVLMMMGGASPALAQTAFIPSTTPPGPIGGARVTGEVTDIMGTTLRLALRNGQAMTIDLSSALANHLVPPVYMGEFVQVQGSLSGTAMMLAAAVTRAKSAPNVWSPDIP